MNHLDITFTTKYFEHVKPHEDDPIGMTIRVNNYVTKKVFLKQGSSAVIIYSDAYRKKRKQRSGTSNGRSEIHRKLTQRGISCCCLGESERERLIQVKERKEKEDNEL